MSSSNTERLTPLLIFLLILFFACSLIAVSLLLAGTITSTIYSKEKDDADGYIKGWCLVIDIVTKEDVCTEERCVNSGDKRTCVDVDYICYKGQWQVDVYLFEDYNNDTKEYSSSSNGVSSSIATSRKERIRQELIDWMDEQHSISDIDTCWHDRNDRRDLLWYQPDVEGLLIAMIVLFTMAFLFCCFSAIIPFIGFLYYTFEETNCFDCV